MYRCPLLVKNFFLQLNKNIFTGEDIFNLLPFNNSVDRATIKGSGIIAILEVYAAKLCTNASCHVGAFPQVSGLKIVYDIYEDNKFDRVSKVHTVSEDGNWYSIDPAKIYPVALTNFLAEGKGSTSSGFPDHIIEHQKGRPDYNVFVDYVKKHSPIKMTTEGRSIINYHPGKYKYGSLTPDFYM